MGHQLRQLCQCFIFALSTHAGNILVKKSTEGSLQLVPIDHGYILPDTFSDLSFEWMFWPQAAQPLGALDLHPVCICPFGSPASQSVSHAMHPGMYLRVAHRIT